MEKIRVGIDLGGSHICVGIIDENSEIIKKYEKNFLEEEKQEIIPLIEEYILNAVYEIQKEYIIDFIGIAIPGTTSNGKILKAVNLGIYNYDIAQSLNLKLNIDIKIRNDAKCACLAEYNNLIKTENFTQLPNMLFLNIGTGIGGGFVYQGKLLEGNKFEGYEFGHTIIKENGIQCKCGKKGCFERYGSILEYKNKVKQRLNIDKNINGDPLRKIMDDNTDKIKDLKDEYTSNLAIGISNLINIFEPDIVILGGGFSYFSYMFIEEIKDKIINSNLLFNQRENIDFRIAKLSNDAGVIGSVS